MSRVSEAFIDISLTDADARVLQLAVVAQMGKQKGILKYEETLLSFKKRNGMKLVSIISKLGVMVQ